MDYQASYLIRHCFGEVNSIYEKTLKHTITNMDWISFTSFLQGSTNDNFNIAIKILNATNTWNYFEKMPW